MSRVGVTVEGGLLAADLIERIALGETNISGQQPKDFGLDAGRLSAEIQSAFSDIRLFWDGYKRRREVSQASPVSLTREAWAIPLFERIGYALRFQRPAPQIGGQSYPISHRTGEAENSTPVHIVAFDHKLGERGDARRSPHALLQEYLNHTDALWGIVTNGRELRLLRNSARSSRPSYLAVDLETILDGNLYNEFALVYRVLHRSRLPQGDSDPQDCLLETWYQQGIKEGGRVRDRLRVGVKAALETLGSGFLRHPANDALRAKLDGNGITESQFYRELLNLIYRLLFLMVAEERRLLFAPSAAAGAGCSDAATGHDVYLRWYGIGRLRERAEKRVGEDGYGDLWEGLKETFRLFREGSAADALGLSALNGELFGVTALPDLEDRDTWLSNRDLLDAIRQLSNFEEEAGRRKAWIPRRVNYGGLDVEELGSIYESLLDYHPQVLRGSPGAGSQSRATFALTGGSQRRETGSYYTRPELVHELIESALVPAIEQCLATAATGEAKEQALLSLTICDPAAGSGHFLLAAARCVGRELAKLRSGEAEPAPEAYRAALRDVIRHCLYAVDKNPLAVDLCKVALWIEGHAPGLPLSFLDHRIRCGDSLIGVLDLDLLKTGVPDAAFRRLTGDDKAVCAELRNRNKRERKAGLAAYWAESDLNELSRRFAKLADMPDATPEEVQHKAAQYRVLTEDSGAISRLRRACDAWTAGFFASRATDQARAAPTTADVWNALAGREDAQRNARIDELSDHFHFFHWRLEFPDVFERGGFHVMLGNPPWDALSPDAKEFFGTYDREVRFLSPADQERRFEKLKADPTIAARWEIYCDDIFKYIRFLKESGRFNLFAPGNLGKGDFNIYRMFVELSLGSTRSNGFVAQIVPEGLYKGANAAAIRAALFSRFMLRLLVGCVNLRGVWFPDVHPQFEFCLYVAKKGSRTETFNAAFRVASPARLEAAGRGQTLNIPVSLVREFSPDALAVMEFAAQAEVDICRKMYGRYPKFGERREGLPHRVYMTEVHMGNDRHLFTEESEDLPVFEGRMVDLYDYRAKGYRSGRGRAADWKELRFGSSEKGIHPQWRIPRDRAPKKLRGRNNQYRIGFCDVVNPDTEKCLVASLIPPETVCGHKVPTILFNGGTLLDALLWLGVANSLTMDFIVRKKVRLTMSYTVMDSLPFPRDWRNTPASQAIMQRVYGLSAVGNEMEAFRLDAPSTALFALESPVENPSDRARIIAEIEALVAGAIYGLSRAEISYVLDPSSVLGPECGIETFRVLKEREYSRIRGIPD